MKPGYVARPLAAGRDPRPGVGLVEPSVERVVLQAGGAGLSGWQALAPGGEPRALVVALHGGGMHAGYFHGRAHPSLSLLSLGASLGFSVLALDRPGYGESRVRFPEGQSMRDQADTLYAALEDFGRAQPQGAGCFLVAHSYGLKVALHMASDPRGARLLGLDGSGAGLRYHPAQLERVQRARTPGADGPSMRDLYWGSEDLYPPGSFEPEIAPTAEVPALELREAPRWPEILPPLAPKVRIPVRLTVAEFEPWWEDGEESRARTRALFSAAPRLEIEVQPKAGHNISLGWAARAYHLRALAFAEECIQARAGGRAGE